MNRQINQYRKYEKIEGEVIRIIKLDIRLDDIVLNDQFEWDINNPENSPDEFAKALCADLGLGSMFILPVAHSIKEQILDYQKVKIFLIFQQILSERNVTYAKMYKIQEQQFHYDPSNIFRDVYLDTTEWQPLVKKITNEEIKKLEKKEERKIRYTQRKK